MSEDQANDAAPIVAGEDGPAPALFPPATSTNGREVLSARGEQGFSLLEILVALAIIATLTALVGPRLLGQVDKSKETTAKVQIKMMKTALTTYIADGGSTPSAEEGLAVLIRNLANSPSWNGPYLDGDELPKDPWGGDYQYVSPNREGDTGKIVSFGADQEPGGEGLNADISG
jgi:general secretion pathway protein G